MNKITIKDFIKQNNLDINLVKSKEAVVAISVAADEKYDAVVKPDNSPHVLMLKKVSDLNMEIDLDEQQAFILSKEAWSKMTKNNIWASKEGRSTSDE